MSSELIIRCEKCFKVLKGKSDRDRISGRCPHCGEIITIQDPVSLERRKEARTIPGITKISLPVPESLTRSEEPAAYRVIYTEVPPVDFIRHRSYHVPLLDLSEGGMGLLVRSGEKMGGLRPGDVFVAELDFPVLVQSIFIKVEVRWIRPVDNGNLLQAGVRFCSPDESLRGVLQVLIKFIASRTNSLEFDKWGAFG